MEVGGGCFGDGGGSIREEDESLSWGFFDGTQWEVRVDFFGDAVACVGGSTGSAGCAMSAEDLPPLLGLVENYVFMLIVSTPAEGMWRVQKFA